MNASEFMDKQIMDLSRSKSSNDFLDLMNPQSDSETKEAGRMAKKSEEIFPSYDFQPISRPIGVSSDSAAAIHSRDASRAWNSADSKSNSSPNRSYSYMNAVEPDKIILGKAENEDGGAIISEIDRTMKKHTDNILYALDGLSARLTQLETRSRQFENSVDDLKVSVGNNYGSTDGRLRQLENILREVQNGMQDLKDKQDVMEAHMKVSKLQMPNAEQLLETQKTPHVDPVQQAASAPQQPNQQYAGPVSSSVPALPPSNVLPPALAPAAAPAPGPSMPLPSQYPQGQMSSLPPRDAYYPPPSHTQGASTQQYKMPIPQQQPPQQQPSAPQHHQLQPAPPAPYSQPPPPQQHQAVPLATPQLQTPVGHRPEEAPYISAPTYPPSVHQPPSQPASAPPPQQFYGVPPPMYESSTGRSNFGFSPGYSPPQGPSEPYQYSGPPSRYGSGSSMKPLSHISGGGSNYPHVPAARPLPQPIPIASSISSAGSGGSGNRVPIDDVIDKVTNMGFPRDHVCATVRKLTENGQSVDLNVVLDKLMNDGDVQPPRGWLGR